MIRSKKTKRQVPGKKKGSAVKQRTKAKAKKMVKKPSSKKPNAKKATKAKKKPGKKPGSSTPRPKDGIKVGGETPKPSLNLPAKIDKASADSPKMGAPSKITRELVDRICNIIRMGMYPDVACAAAGLRRPTIFDWFKRGALGDDSENGLYIYFSDSVWQAQAEGEMRDLSQVDIAANGRPAEFDAAGNKVMDAIKPVWAAAAWKLQKRHQQRWGEQQLKNLGLGTGGSQSISQAQKEAEIKSTQMDDEAMDMIEKLSEKLTIIDAETGEVEE